MTFYGGGTTGDSGSAGRAAAAAASDASAAKREVSQLEDQVDRMRLACAAMWQLVKERTGLTEQDLITRIALIDAKDGLADGKFSHAPRKCVKCSRTVKDRQQKCMYCGEIQPFEGVFESL